MEATTTNGLKLVSVEVKPEPARVFPLADQEAPTRYKEILRGAIIDPGATIPEPETLLSLNDTPILWRGCKAFVCSVAKARKTTTLTLIGSILLGRDEGANGFQAREGCRVLFIDTEQARYDTQRIAERIARLCGSTREGLRSRLQVLSLNKFSPEDIKGVMETAVIDFRPDVLILDNWTDCVPSVMDDKECTKFSQELRRLVEVYDLALFSVIHSNESAGEAPRFRGWAQEEARKSDLTLFLQDMSNHTDPELQGDYSRARFGKCRGKRPDEFAISINEEGLPYIYHHEPDITPKPGKYAPILEKISPEGLRYKEICEVVANIDPTNPKSTPTAKRWVADMERMGLVRKVASPEGVRYYLPETSTPETDLPF